MPCALTPANEAERLAALRSYDVLDSACEESFDTIARLAARLTESPTALVSLVDKDRQWFKARQGFEFQETHRDYAFCAHAILETSRPTVVNDATMDCRFADNPFVLGAPCIRFYAGFPLVNPEGFALGTLCVLDTKPREIAPDMLDALSALAQSVVTTLELRRAVHQMRDLALTDALTGLPNRPSFLNALDQALALQRRHGHSFGLLYLDLDNFKTVNDEHGHATGDLVLKVAAEAFHAAVRREDTAARVGGDEFAAVLTNCEGAVVEQAAERIRATVRDRMKTTGCPITVSIGGVTFLVPPCSPGDALAAADAAMYAAKAAGRNCTFCCEFTQPACSIATA